MTTTLVRGAATVALTAALAVGVGAGTASAAPAAPGAAPAPSAQPAYCAGLAKLQARFPRLVERLPRQVVARCATSSNEVIILPGTGNGYEGGLAS